MPGGEPAAPPPPPGPGGAPAGGDGQGGLAGALAAALSQRKKKVSGSGESLLLFSHAIVGSLGRKMLTWLQMMRRMTMTTGETVVWVSELLVVEWSQASCIFSLQNVCPGGWDGESSMLRGV